MNAASVQPACAISFGPPAQGSFSNHFASKEASGLDIINIHDADNFKMIAETPRKRGSVFNRDPRSNPSSQPSAQRRRCWMAGPYSDGKRT
jgi:hypothetical protein